MGEITPAMRVRAARMAYEALPLDERMVIAALAAELQLELRRRNRELRVGGVTCLEILAAIGQALNERARTTEEQGAEHG